MANIINKLVIFCLILSTSLQADTLINRYANGVPKGLPVTAGLFEYEHKVLEVGIQHPVNQCLYVEGATGCYYDGDFGAVLSPTSSISEASFGLQVASGPISVKFSQGVSYLPQIKNIGSTNDREVCPCRDGIKE
jgi:hypothetical protein